MCTRGRGVCACLGVRAWAHNKHVRNSDRTGEEVLELGEPFTNTCSKMRKVPYTLQRVGVRGGGSR
jgi:hypothetical protein